MLGVGQQFLVRSSAGAAVRSDRGAHFDRIAPSDRRIGKSSAKSRFDDAAACFTASHLDDVQDIIAILETQSHLLHDKWLALNDACMRLAGYRKIYGRIVLSVDAMPYFLAKFGAGADARSRSAPARYNGSPFP